MPQDVSPVRMPRSMMRQTAAQPDELRPITFERDFTEMAAGSVLVSFGTHPGAVHRVGRRGRPALDAGQRQGLGHRRVLDAARAPHPSGSNARRRRGKPSGRTQEIQRLIGRSLRACATCERSASARSSSTATCCRPTAARAPRRSAAATSRCTTPSAASWRQVRSSSHPLTERARRSRSASSTACPCSTCPTWRTRPPRST